MPPCALWRETTNQTPQGAPIVALRESGVRCTLYRQHSLKNSGVCCRWGLA